MVSFWPRPRTTVCIDRNVFVPVKIKISRNELRVYIAMSSTASPFRFGAQGAIKQKSRNGMDANYLCSFVLNRRKKRIDLSTG